MEGSEQQAESPALFLCSKTISLTSTLPGAKGRPREATDAVLLWSPDQRAHPTHGTLWEAAAGASQKGW